MPRDEPVQTYYPSARVRFIVRLEDFGAPDTPAPPEKPPQLRKGTGRDQSETKLTVDTQEDGSLILLGPGDDPSWLAGPQSQIESDDALTHVIDGVIPVSASLKLNGIRTADTLSLEVPFRDFPFDPRAVRACGVEFLLGCVSAEDYQRGMRGEIRSDAVRGGGLRYNVIADEYISSTGHTRSNVRFQGWIDEFEASWESSDAPTVRIECTDNTRLLIEQDAPPKLSISPDSPIDRAIADYLANFPQYRGISVAYLPRVESAKIPKLSDALAKTKFQPRLGPPPATGGTSKIKVWDYLTDVVGAIGHSIRFEGTTVIVQLPRTLYDARFIGRPDDSFIGRRLPSGRVLSNRLYLYGRNVEKMAFKRKFATYPPQNIEIRCYDAGQKKTRVARYPEKGDRQKKLAPGNAAEQKWIVLRVSGIKDDKFLKLLAQTAYEQIGRNELEVRLSTVNLASFGGGNLDPDALDCKPGDSIDVEVLREPTIGRGPSDGGSTVGEFAEKMKTGAADFLRGLGFSDKLARAYQRTIEHVGVQTTFRVKGVSYSWEWDRGVVIDFELINYVEIRSDVDLPADQQTTPADVSNAAATGNDVPDVVVADEIGNV